MDPALLAPLLLASETPTDDELMVKGLPQLSVRCATIKVTHKHVLKKAVKKLGVSIHGYDFSSLGGDEVIASVTMDIPSYPGNELIKRKEFHGEWSVFSSEAKESACLAALTYLKEKGLIVVHDHNFIELSKYKKMFAEAHFWSTAFYDRATILEEKLAAKPSNVIPTQLAISNAPTMGTSIGNLESTPPSGSITRTSARDLKGGKLQHHAIQKKLFPHN